MLAYIIRVYISLLTGVTAGLVILKQKASAKLAAITANKVS